MKHNTADPSSAPNTDDSGDDLGRELERLNDLLDRGLSEVSDIEIDEITKGITEEDLEERCDADGSLKIVRSEFSQAKQIGDFIFEDRIQFIVEDRRKSVEEIALEELEILKDVEPEQLIARHRITESTQDKFRTLVDELTGVSPDKTGVVVRTDGARLSFYAARKGKVVVFRKTIHVIPCDRDGFCTVKINHDFMEASIDLVASKGSGKKIVFSAVLAELEKNDVIKGIDRSRIEEAVDRVNNDGSTLSGIVVARGQPPQDGKDAGVLFHFPTETPDIGFRILPDGRIDYRKQAPIKMVQRGDLLATVTPAEAGRDGFRVNGAVLPAVEGSSDVLIEGENVRKGEDGKTFYAECDGLISFHDKILNVFPHYQVDGDVDLKCGNILFNGSVSVLGSVRSGFEVKAAGDIFVAGSVESATLEAGRDIRINGAVVGGGATSVKAGRNIFAGHAQNALLEAEGDVVVVRSIMHSTIYSTGKVYLHDRTGAIVGGMVSALRGMEVMSVGSHMGTPTEIVAGNDFLIQRKRKELLEIGSFHQANLTKIDQVLRPLMEIVKKGVPLGSEKKQRLTTIVEKRKNIAKQLRIIRQRVASLSEVDPSAIDAVIIIQRTLYQDVVVKIGPAFFKNHEELVGVRCKLAGKENKIDFKAINNVSF